MRIETARLLIRGFREEDVDAFAAYHDDLEWMRFQGFKGRPRGVYRSVLLSDRPLESGRQFALVNRESAELLGDLYLQRAGTTYRVGYTVAPAFARRGFAREALLALIGWIIDEGGAPGSRACGFRPSGRA